MPPAAKPSQASLEGLAWTATWDRLFRKKLDFEKSKSKKNNKNCPKICWNGFRKMIGGSREVRKGQNCAPNPLEGLPDLKNPLKNSKKVKNHENQENQRFFVFFLFPGVGPIVVIFTVWGHPLQSFHLSKPLRDLGKLLKWSQTVPKPIPRPSQNDPKIIPSDQKSRKMILRSGDLRKEQNCILNPLEGLPDLKSFFFNSKKANKSKEI